MLLKGRAVVVCLCLAVGAARADNVIEEWWHAPGIAYAIDQNLETILIMAPGTYKFQATDGSALGQIQWIHVAEGVTGTVDLYILRDPNDANDPNGPPYDPDNPWGALDVGMVGFTSGTPPPGLTLRLRELRVAGQLGPDPDDLPTRATAAWIGTCVIGGAVHKDVELESMDLVTFSTPELDGNLEITGTYENMGTISVTHFNAPHQINIAHDFDGDIILGDSGNQEPVSGKLHIGRDARGSIATYPSFAGTMIIVRDMYAQLWCGTLYGVVDICGSLAAYGSVQSAYVRGTLFISGDIAPNVVPQTPRVTIFGAIARDPGDPNAPNARVEIGSPTRVVEGTVQVQQGIADTGALTVYADIAATGRVEIGTDVSGTLTASGTLDGVLQIAGDVQSHALVQIDGAIGASGAVLVGSGVLGALRTTQSIAASPDPESSQIWIAGEVVGDPQDPSAGRVLIEGESAEIHGRLVIGGVNADGLVNVTVPSGLALDGKIEVGTLAGVLDFAGDVGGVVEVQSSPAGGLIHAGGSMNGALSTETSLGADMHIDADLTGAISTTGHLGPAMSG